MAITFKALKWRKALSSLQAADSMSNLNTPLRLQRGTMHDIVISAVLRKLSEHSPFRTYSHAVVVNAVMEQLRHGASVIGLRDGKLVAYGGWIRVSLADANVWLDGGIIPCAKWVDGDAAIATIIVADHPSDLRCIVKGVSHMCAGTPVYRMRVFSDQRGERKLAPITGREQRGLHGFTN